MGATETIRTLREQGLSDNQIVQRLQQEGHTAQSIHEALQMADMRNSFGQQGPQPSMGPPQNPMQGQPQSMVPPQQMPPPMGQQEQQSDDYSDDVEELIEQVIEEKWGELKRSVDKITGWKDQTEQRISALEQSMKDLKSQFDQLHNSIIGKVGEYDKNIVEVGSQLKAMEKVFSQVLPQFTENVNELNRITQRVKGQQNQSSGIPQQPSDQ